MGSKGEVCIGHKTRECFEASLKLKKLKADLIKEKQTPTNVSSLAITNTARSVQMQLALMFSHVVLPNGMATKQRSTVHLMVIYLKH